MAIPQDQQNLLAGQKLYFAATERQSAYKIGECLAGLLFHLDPELNRPRVVVCIGTDRSTGDSLGPLVGSRLMPLGKTFYHIYGTLDDPIHATNLVERKAAIEAAHPEAIIIAIDASLGKLEQVGQVAMAQGSLRPGAGVKKDLPEIGDLQITGIVNAGGFLDFLILQNTRLAGVVKLAETISQGLLFAYYQAARQQKKATAVLG